MCYPTLSPHLRGVILVAAVLMAVLAMQPAHGASQKNDVNPSQSTADHRTFKQLQGPLAIDEITKICLDCHNVASKQIHKTTHWNWDVVSRHTGQKLGKKNVINNFFLSVKSNIKSCAVCHVSFDWKDEEFDFASEEQVDCLMCHDTTGTYALEKFHESRAQCWVCHDVKPKRKKSEPIDLAFIARHVGPTSRATCGACHFRGGGGDGVKHGDLDSSLLKPGRSLDVHMDAGGRDFTCATCHKGGQHVVKGSLYAPTPNDPKGVASIGNGRATCQSCHGNAPMKDARLNKHTDRIACQTCHIPEIARGGVSTLMSWDWSTAGAPKNKGKVLVKTDARNRVTYTARKGDLSWGDNVVPEYVWFNGIVDYTLPGDTIDVDEEIAINTYRGGADDPNSRIFPVKVFRGRQPVDTANRTLAVPHLAGRKRDAYWRGYEWEPALAAGMEAAGLAFSGAFDFAETRMLRPINHMVAPAEDALACVDCHTDNGRLANVEGIYIPGRDSFAFVEWVGAILLTMTIGAALIHGILRAVFRVVRRERS